MPWCAELNHSLQSRQDLTSQFSLMIRHRCSMTLIAVSLQICALNLWLVVIFCLCDNVVLNEGLNDFQSIGMFFRSITVNSFATARLGFRAQVQFA